MKIRIFTGIALLAFVMPAFGQVNSIPAARHLVVKGHAEMEVLPDRFTIHMTVEAVDMRPEASRNRVQSHVAELLQSMTAAHVLQDQVTATAITIKPKTGYNKDDEEVFKGTEVSRDIEATFASPEDLRSFLSSLQTSTEVQVEGIDTSYSMHEQIEAELREKAVTSTRQKADELAKAYGARVAGLYAVSEVAPSFGYGVDAFAGESGGSNTLDRIVVTGSRIHPEELEVGTITLKSDIYAVFLLAD